MQTIIPVVIHQKCDLLKSIKTDAQGKEEPECQRVREYILIKILNKEICIFKYQKNDNINAHAKR